MLMPTTKTTMQTSQYMFLFKTAPIHFYNPHPFGKTNVVPLYPPIHSSLSVIHH